ncbi:unnamed protein product [Cylindrotheca closterium]|uniref:SET domain-containing protein n=1 Tax=Cylindrotheca closterium TaxID=2856 RepID=A0AAD2JNB6_9STRA|nr:unnamed protein product [Cylindrotheca closterium]
MPNKKKAKSKAKNKTKASNNAPTQNGGNIAAAESKENNSGGEGVQVVDTNSELGRVAIATKDFQTGEVVLREEPAVSFNTQDGYVGLWEAYLKATPEQQAAIMKMQADSVEQDPERMGLIQDEFQRYQKETKLDTATASKLDFKLARTLVEIVLINAHDVRTEGTGNYAEYEDIQAGSKTALFPLGSKLEHHCAPNISFDTTPQGQLEYITETVKIAQGERLTISYTGHVYEEPRQIRRGNILQLKRFLCNCTRCLGWDECNPLNCPQCSTLTTRSQKSPLIGTLFQWGKDSSWHCQVCTYKGRTEDDFIAKQLNEHRSWSQKIDTIMERLETTGFHPSMVMESSILQNVFATKLSALHWLHPKAYHTLRIVSTSQARLLMKQQKKTSRDPGVITMLQMAGKCQLEHFVWLSRNISLVQQEHHHYQYHSGAATTSAETTTAAKTTMLQELCQTVGSFAPLQERNLRTKESLEPYLESIISRGDGASNNGDYNASLLLNINSQTVELVFHAGLDLILAGHSQLVAKLYQCFQTMLQQWRILSPDNQKRIQLLIKSKGKNNPFPNHIIS